VNGESEAGLGRAGVHVVSAEGKEVAFAAWLLEHLRAAHTPRPDLRRGAPQGTAQGADDSVLGALEGGSGGSAAFWSKGG